jgi:cysteinyl-tRNA synthetase
LDSSILISDFFEHFKPRIEKLFVLKSRYNVNCRISSSVEEECLEKLENLLNFIGENTTLLKMHIAGEKSRNQNEIIIEEPDIILIELLMRDRFNKLSQKARTEGRPSPEIEQELLRILEETLVDFLEEKLKSSAILRMEEIDAFLAKCLKDFLQIRNAFREQMKQIALKTDIDPDSELVDEIKKLGIPKKDSIHIASAMQFAATNNLSTVFVTVDYKTIINFQEQLYNQFKF